MRKTAMTVPAESEIGITASSLVPGWAADGARAARARCGSRRRRYSCTEVHAAVTAEVRADTHRRRGASANAVVRPARQPRAKRLPGDDGVEAQALGVAGILAAAEVAVPASVSGWVSENPSGAAGKMSHGRWPLSRTRKNGTQGLCER